jgi:3-deoxy-D-manno-octulosonic-acid transferase
VYLLYSVLLTLGVIALLPRFAFDALRNGKYVAGLRERLGQPPSVEAEGARPVIWLHCVSVGEAQAARPLVKTLLQKFPAHALVVSTITLTGQRIAREVFKDEAAAVIYFPFDWAWTTRRALRKINPVAVLIMETELWPRFLRECRARRIPVALVNGRLSERSCRRYQWIPRFTSRIVNDLELAVMQSDADAERIRTLGLTAERVRISGNIKFDAEIETPQQQALTAQLRQRFAFNNARHLIVAASTHAPEERIIIESFKHLRRTLKQPSATLNQSGTTSNATSYVALPRLLIAPRHPERFAEVASLLKASGLIWERRSSAACAGDATCDVILLDTIGELRAVYPLATLVFVGGSIARTGGHNVLEPAAAGACIITGAHTFNFTAITRAFLDADALIQLPVLPEAEASAQLAGVFQNLLFDSQCRNAIASHARNVLEQNRGATDRTIEFIAPLISSSLARHDNERYESAKEARRGALTP